MKKYFIIPLSALLLGFALVNLTACKDNKESNSYTEEMKEETTRENNEEVLENVVQEPKDNYKILKSMGFKFPDSLHFKNTVETKFGLNLDSIPADLEEYSLESEPLIREEGGDSYPYLHPKEKYLTHLELFYNYESLDDYVLDSLLYHYNNYVFYDSKASFVYLQQNDAYLLYQLVQDYGYIDEPLRDLIFPILANMDDLTHPFSISTLMGRNGINGKWKLRSDLYKQFSEYYPNNLIHFNFASIIMENEQYEGESYKDMAFVLNEEVLNHFERNYQGAIILGLVDRYVNKYPDFRKELEANNYFEMQKLKWYMEVIFLEEGEEP